MQIQHTDKEQIDQIKKWWNESGKGIAVAVVVGLLIGFGWKFWRQHSANQEAAASSIYQQVMMAESVSDIKAVQKHSQQLMTEFKSSSYAAMANLWLAKDAVAQTDYASALKSLNWVIQNASKDDFKQLARIRSSAVLIAMKKPDQAIAVLNQVNSVNYKPLVNEAKGDAYIAKGDIQQGRHFYELAKQSMSAKYAQDPSLMLKLAQYPTSAKPVKSTATPTVKKQG